MNHKRIINFIVALFVVFTTFFVTACSFGNVGGDDDDDDIVNPPTTPGTEKTIDELFSKFKIITGDESVTVYDPTTQTNKNFNSLLERQISVLAEDILYRLTAVYGAGASEEHLLYDEEYSYGSSLAKILSENLIDKKFDQISSTKYYLTSDNQSIESGLFEFDMNQVASYAAWLNSGTYSSWNVVDRILSLEFGINSGYVWNTTTKNFETNLSTNKNWQWNYGYEYVGGGLGNYELTGGSIELANDGFGNYNYVAGNLVFVGYNMGNYDVINPTYTATSGGNYNVINFQTTMTVQNGFDNYYNAYSDDLELAIANMLAMSNHTGVGYSTLQSATAGIDHLGFTQTDRENITAYILDTVIGSDLVASDDDLLEQIVSPSILNGSVLNVSNTTSSSAIMQLENAGLHYYKAYSLIVPELVNRALANSFGGVESDRIDYNGFGEPSTDGQGFVQYVVDIDDLESSNDLYLDQDNPNYASNDEIYLLYPKMLRSSQYDIDIEPLPELETGEYPEPVTTGLVNIKQIYLQPKDDAALLELWFLIGTQENVRVQFQVNIKYVANGVTYLDETVSSYTNTTNSNKKIFDITGAYDTASIYGDEQIPWYFDLNISDQFIVEDGKYTSIDYSQQSTDYPAMQEYNGVDTNNYDLWNNNPFGMDGYPSGDNYVEMTFIILNAWTILGTTQTPMSTSDVLFNVGFTDPIF